MLRSCPKCGNRNHISAFVCPCGYRLVGKPEPKPQTELESSAATPYQKIFPAKSPPLPEPPLPPAPRVPAREELEKQAIREALLAEESRKPASGKLKINLKRSFVAVSLLILTGAVVLAVLGGFTGITENSAGEPDEKEQVSLADKSLAPDARYSAANNPADKNSVEGKVVDVSSGDMITIADINNQEYQIKLEGIDAPELEQEFGREARKNLFTLVFGKTVQVNLQEPGVDGLTVGKVLLNGKNVSLEQLKAGLAWYDRSVALEQSDNDLYAYHETITKRNGFGLWAAANPLPPWEYRNKTKNPDQGENQVIASDRDSESQIVASYSDSEIPEAVPNTEPEAGTIIFQETRNATESQMASTETAPKPAYIKSPPFSESPSPIKSPTPVKSPTPMKSPTSVVISPPSQKALTIVSTGYERKPTPVSRTATARCGDGTLSYSGTRSETCAGRGGVAEWLDGSTSPAKTSRRDGNNNPAPRGGCFIIDGGKKVYLEREICGN